MTMSETRYVLSFITIVPPHNKVIDSQQVAAISLDSALAVSLYLGPVASLQGFDAVLCSSCCAGVCCLILLSSG